MDVLLEALDGELDVEIVKCPEVLLRMFPGVRAYPGPPFSLIMTTDKIMKSNGKIVVDASTLSALVVGEPGLALLVSAIAGQMPREPSKTSVQKSEDQNVSSDDGSFLREVDAELADPILRQIARSLLDAVRELQPTGHLRRGTAGKYVNYPDNFVGFTVQKRNQALLVYVRESAVTKSASQLRVGADRRPYVRFWVTSQDQVAEAENAIKASWNRAR